MGLVSNFARPRNWSSRLTLLPAVVVGGGLMVTVATAATTANASSSSRGKVVVMEARRGRFGEILITGEGFTLYRDSADRPDHPTCTGECAVAWPPLTLPKGVTAAMPGKGVTGLGAVRLAHGLLQVTYQEVPLYLFASDAKPGDVEGQGVGGFFVLHPKIAPKSLPKSTVATAGNATSTSSTSSTSTSTTSAYNAPTTAAPTTAATTTPTTVATTTVTTSGSSWA